MRLLPREVGPTITVYWRLSRLGLRQMYPPLCDTWPFIIVDKWLVTVSTKWLALTTQFYKYSDWFNLVIMVDNLQGDLQGRVCLCLVKRAVKAEVLLPNFYVKYPQTPKVDWRLVERRF